MEHKNFKLGLSDREELEETNMNGEQQVKRLKKEVDEVGEDCFVYKLSNKRSVVVHRVGGLTFVSIEKFRQVGGSQVPAGKGGYTTKSTFESAISFPAEEWETFVKLIPEIDEAIKTIGTNSRHEIDSKQTEDECRRSECDTVQIEDECQRSERDLKQKEDASVLGVAPVELFPSRFYGEKEKYPIWAQQMKSHLKHLKVAYVLSEPSPKIILKPGAKFKEFVQLKAAQERWEGDDYNCRFMILNNLCDGLFLCYAKQSRTAKELWEKIKSICQVDPPPEEEEEEQQQQGEEQVEEEEEEEEVSASYIADEEAAGRASSN